ncbi:MAG TPA: glycosyltransferase family 2 protein [Bdellovibrionota bacterium]|nr:glycosyltransferase family 2 protein [Bdellovibrionota bacterium]
MDLAIAYRVYPGVSKTPILHQDNKLLLAEAAFRSFTRSLTGLDAKIWVILDGCPSEYRAAFEKHHPAGKLIFVNTDKIGNASTFQLQGKILLEQEDAELVYFAEDDYGYAPGEFQQLVNFIRKGRDVDFVTPYDHPDYYSHPMHQVPSETQEFEGRSWRSAASTCLTFLTTRSVLNRTWPFFSNFAQGATDAATWLLLTKMGLFSPRRLVSSMKNWDEFTIYARAWKHGGLRNFVSPRYKLWVPVPGIATHLESTGIASGHDWKAYLES